MALYSYTAYDASGVRTTGQIQAVSRSSALDALSRKGCFPTELADATSSLPHWSQRELFGPRPLSISNLCLFTRELASLMRASIPVDECLRLIAVQPMLPRKVQGIVRNLQTRISEGQSLSASIAEQGVAFPEYYWRLIQAGEMAGTLDTALEDLASYLETTAAMRGRVASALIYPTILLVAAVMAISVVMTVLLPALAPLFDEARVPPPAIISVLTGVETFLRENGLWLGVLAAAMAIGLGLTLTLRPARAIADRALLSIPVVGAVIERRETGRLARTLATLLKNGVPLVDATRVAGTVVSNRALALVVEQASQEIREGGTLSAHMTRSERFSELFLRLVSIGEKSGQLDAMLLRAADIYDSALSRQLQRLIGLITPVATVVIGGVVGVLILSVMSALMSINELALQ